MPEIVPVTVGSFLPIATSIVSLLSFNFSKAIFTFKLLAMVLFTESSIDKANKDFESDIAFSHEIYNALNQKLHSKAIFLGEIKLKGREKATKVYSV